jgi:hypothetical protein
MCPGPSKGEKVRLKALIVLAACLASGAAAAIPFAVGGRVSPLLSFMHPDTEAAAMNAFIFSSGESALSLPGPGVAAGLFGELALFSFLSIGTELDYAFRDAYCIGTGTENDGDWWRIQSSTIGLTLYSRFTFFRLAKGSLQADGGLYFGLMPKAADERLVVSGYAIDVDGSASVRDILTGARAGIDWEWALGSASPLVIRTGLRFEYLFLSAHDPTEPYQLPLSAGLRASLAYIDRGKPKSTMVPAKEAGLMP